MRVRTVETPELGNRSYLVDDGTTTVVIDPQRDIDRLDPLLESDVAHVLETHIHNDYVTGGLELARRTGADYGVNAADPVAFERRPLAEGQVLRAGALEVRVLATPGHTDTHLSYLVRDTSQPSQPSALFSGGSLLYGTVGRTDLLGTDRTHELTHAQYRTAHRLGALPAETLLFPTHGFGSFCSAAPASGASSSTVGDELLANVALRASSEETFVAELIAGLTDYPSYYAHMAPLNRRGPSVPALDLPAPLTPGAVATALRRGVRVVDLRQAPEYAARHLVGAVSIPLGQQFATYVGWLTPFGEPLVVLAPSDAELREARRALLRIGYDRFEAAAGPVDAVAPPDTPRGAYRRATFDELLAELSDGDVVLDVRRADEYHAAHLPRAIHIPLHELDKRHPELPRARVWVHCAGGFRAGTAASILDAHGFDVVHVDDSFDQEAVRRALTAPE